MQIIQIKKKIINYINFFINNNNLKYLLNIIQDYKYKMYTNYQFHIICNEILFVM